MRTDSRSIRRYVDAVPLSALAIVAVSAPVLAIPPQAGAGDRVAVIFAPWTSKGEAVRRVVSAGGTPIGYGRFPFVIIAHSMTGAFAKRVRGAGVWMFLDASAFVGCPQAGRP